MRTSEGPFEDYEAIIKSNSVQERDVLLLITAQNMYKNHIDIDKIESSV